MPKILIREDDRTTPGTPGSYDNYAVLIAGFAGSESEIAEPLVRADSNNAYEFKSAQVFKDTIGLVAPEMEKRTEDGVYQLKHYGNQMAYELLRLGYPVIYKSLGNLQDDYATFEDVVSTLTDELMWEPFKDKASYDFRFVTHGLLASTEMPISVSNELSDAKIAKDDAEKGLAELDKLQKDADEQKIELETDPNFEMALYLTEQYLALAAKDEFSAIFTDKNTGKIYSTYDIAYERLSAILENSNQTIKRIDNSYFTTGCINQVNANIANLAKYVTVDNPTNKTVYGRGDCIALIELDEQCYTTAKETITDPIDLIISGINEMKEIDSSNGKYCAMTVPSVTYKMASTKEFNFNKTFPGAFHYLTCFINSIGLGFKEWYAAAGYTRGVSSYTIDTATVKLGEIAINALEPRNITDAENDPKFACNVIANFRGSYYLWGNRTAHPLGKKGSLDTGDLVASSFLNIRQLCTTIKKQLYVACRTFTFDPNSDSLWVNFINAIRPTLEVMKADQGIRDYKIIKIYTDTKATLKARIRIIPIEAVEDFDLEILLEDSFGEALTVNE